MNITSARYFSIQYILPRLPEFMAQNPQLRIKLELVERLPNMAQEGVDLLVLWLNDSRSMPECAIQVMGIVNFHEYMINDALYSFFYG